MAYTSDLKSLQRRLEKAKKLRKYEERNEEAAWRGL
jgi:hypothetical protein